MAVLPFDLLSVVLCLDLNMTVGSNRLEEYRCYYSCHLSTFSHSLGDCLGPFSLLLLVILLDSVLA